MNQKKHTNSWYRKKCVVKAKKIALERDGYTCQKCGRQKGEWKIHGSHVFPEGRYVSMSADVENIKALCYSCHFQWWHKNPIESSEWFKKQFPERYRNLKRRSMKSEVVDWKKRWEIMKTL